MTKFTPTRHKIMTAVLITTSALLLQACSSNSAHDANAETVKTTKPYAKPGAAISFSSNYDGHTAVGETENIQITINEQYETGTLTVDINASEGLSLSSASQTSFSLADNGDKFMDISVSAQADGKYYINFQALADIGDGQVMPRTHAIAIYVGDEANYKTTVDTRTIEDTKDGKIIIMEAEETIK